MTIVTLDRCNCQSDCMDWMAFFPSLILLYHTISRVGTVVWALAFHWHGLGSILSLMSCVGWVCRLPILLWEVFPLVLRFPVSPKTKNCMWSSLICTIVSSISKATMLWFNPLRLDHKSNHISNNELIRWTDWWKWKQTSKRWVQYRQ